MSRPAERGFSLVELLVSLVILTTGVLMLAGGSLFVTRNLMRARMNTIAGAMAQAKADELRVLAAVGSPACRSTQFRSSARATVANGVTLSWIVSAGLALRTVQVVTSYPVTPSRTRTDTLTTQVPC